MDPTVIAGLVVYWVAFGGMFAAVAPWALNEKDELLENEEVDKYTTLAEASSILHEHPSEEEDINVSRS